MNRIIFTIILCIALSSAHAQKIVRNYHGTPLPEASQGFEQDSR